MSEVKRFYFSVEDLGAVADGKSDCTYALQSAGFYVHASEFDRVTAECKALQERLNAADQANDDLVAENKNFKEVLRAHVYHVGLVGTQAEMDQLISAINGANND